MSETRVRSTIPPVGPRALVLAIVALAAMGAGYFIGESGNTTSPQPGPSQEPARSRTGRSESTYFPYADAGWKEFFGSGGGIAVVQISESTLERMDCRDLDLPLFEGRVDPDSVEYYLRPDDKVFSWFETSATAGSVTGWIAYRDARCVRRLAPEIRTFVKEALAAYRHSGTVASGHPDGR